MFLAKITIIILNYNFISEYTQETVVERSYYLNNTNSKVAIAEDILDLTVRRRYGDLDTSVYESSSLQNATVKSSLQNIQGKYLLHVHMYFMHRRHSASLVQHFVQLVVIASRITITSNRKRSREEKKNMKCT